MSASLVGSEMCIRDSVCRSSVFAVCGRPPTALCLRRSGLVSQNRRRVAVSYTHLTLPTICSV
eukprot:7128539-Alexandrium_andersonii.AAC.1